MIIRENGFASFGTNSNKRTFIQCNFKAQGIKITEKSDGWHSLARILLGQFDVDLIVVSKI
jgi:hypothetical protein